MIRPNILHSLSNQKAVRPQQIEKDYIISWLLWGISRHPLLKEVLAFKGGTCILKVYIKNYRYSEDMDFTLVPQVGREVSDEDIYQAFDQVFEDIKKCSNIDLSIAEDSKGVHTKSNSIKFYVSYVGPLGGKGDSVKIDITRGEKLEFDMVKHEVLHEYPDLAEEGEFKIQCYDLKEIVIEKMVALIGRTVPRDLYDFDYLTSIEGVEVEDVFYEFEQKAMHKGLNPAIFVEKVIQKQKTFEKAWENNLSHQIKNLPAFKDIWRRVGRQLRKIKKIK